MRNNLHIKENILLLGVFASIFLPPIFRLAGVGFRIDDIVFLGALPTLYLLEQRKLIVNNHLKIFLLVIFSILISIIYGYSFLDVPFNWGDFNEVFRILKPLMIFLYIYLLDQEYLKKKTYQWLFVGSFAVIGIAFLEYFSNSFAAFMGGLYSSELQTVGMLSVLRRVIVTGGNPNDGGAILLYFLCFNISNFFLSKRWICFVLTLFLLLSIFMTSSRTALIAVAVICCLSLMLFNSRYLKKIFLAISVSLIAFICWNHFQYVSSGFDLFVRNENNSWIVRQNNFVEAIEYFKQSPILGWGIAKSIHTTILDGEYFLLLKRFGVIGLFLVILFISYAPRKFFFAFKESLDIKTLILGNTLICYFIASLVIMVSNNFFSGYQLLIMYIFIGAIVLRSINPARNSMIS